MHQLPGFTGIAWRAVRAQHQDFGAGDRLANGVRPTIDFSGGRYVERNAWVRPYIRNTWVCGSACRSLASVDCGMAPPEFVM